MNESGEMFVLSAVDLAMAAKLALACLLGAALGLQREVTRHPAGLRTHILVALGASSFMMLGLAAVDGGMAVPVDAGRIAQGIITGVGFIGAGAIMKEGANVHGLTTAASLWVASAVGMFVASGLLVSATFITLLAVSTLMLVYRAH